MPAAPGSPLDGTTRLIIDGTNLLFRLGGRGTVAPPGAVIGRLRALIPAAIEIDLVFDGAGHGVTGRLAHGMRVRYSGRWTADKAILELADEAATAGGGVAAVAGVLVVTDDRDLRYRLAVRGVRTVPLVWMTGRLDRTTLAAPSAANRRPTLGAGTPATQPGAVEAPERPRWTPGRGATAKVGPGFRVARHKRHPRHP